MQDRISKFAGVEPAAPPPISFTERRQRFAAYPQNSRRQLTHFQSTLDNVGCNVTETSGATKLHAVNSFDPVFKTFYTNRNPYYKSHSDILLYVSVGHFAAYAAVFPTDCNGFNIR